MNAHLDDETISDAVDGGAGGLALVHLQACETCRRRFRQLHAAAAAVAEPVPQRPPAEIDHAVALALEAPAGNVVALRRRGHLAAIAGVAAALLLAAGVGRLVTAAGTRKAASTAIAPSGGLAGGVGASAAGPLLVVVPDLGSQSDPHAVLRLILAELAQGRAAGAAPAFGVSGPSPQTGSPTAGPNAPGAAPATSTLAARAAVCAPAGAAEAGLPAGSVRLSLVAGLRWRNEDALVLVYQRSGPTSGGGLAGVVIRAADCALLARLPF